MTEATWGPTTHIGWYWRVAGLVGLSFVLFAWVASQPAVPQPLAYHDFADQRVFLGLPHFWNVASNLPFGIVGLLGCGWLLHGRTRSRAFIKEAERTAYFVFFFGEFLTCFGSGYYHAAPTNATLVWDRLAFSLLLTSVFSIVVTEFVSDRIGRSLLVPMVALGLLSVATWAWSERMGVGDMRLYLSVQFYPVIAIPVILLLFPSRYTLGAGFWVLWGLFVVAKLAELYDAPIFSALGFWSGHTLKHLIAAAATCVPLAMLWKREAHRDDPALEVVPDAEREAAPRASQRSA